VWELCEEEFVRGRRFVALPSRVVARVLSHESVDAAGEMVDVCVLPSQEALHVRLSVDSCLPGDLDTVPKNLLASKRVQNTEGQRLCRDSFVADQFVGREWLRCPDHIVVGRVVLAISQADIVWKCFERFENCGFLSSVLHDLVIFAVWSLADEVQLVHVHPLWLLGDLDVVGDDPPLLIEMVVRAMIDAEAMLKCQVDGAERFLFLGTFDPERNEIGFCVYFRTLVGSQSVGDPDRASQSTSRGCERCLIGRTRSVGESRRGRGCLPLPLPLWTVSNDISGILRMMAYLFVSFWVARHDVFVAVVVVCCEG
jgi:hypothetical protein